MLRFISSPSLSRSGGTSCAGRCSATPPCSVAARPMPTWDFERPGDRLERPGPQVDACHAAHQHGDQMPVGGDMIAVPGSRRPRGRLRRQRFVIRFQSTMAPSWRGARTSGRPDSWDRIWLRLISALTAAPNSGHQRVTGTARSNRTRSTRSRAQAAPNPLPTQKKFYERVSPTASATAAPTSSRLAKSAPKASHTAANLASQTPPIGAVAVLAGCVGQGPASM